MHPSNLGFFPCTAFVGLYVDVTLIEAI